MQKTLFSFLTISFLCFFTKVKAQENCKCTEADALRPQIGKYFNSGKLDSAEIILTQLKTSQYVKLYI
jgi:hypothetical protein